MKKSPAPTLFDEPPQSGVAADAQLFDSFGMPRNAETALAMSEAQVRMAVLNRVGSIDGETGAEFSASAGKADDGSPLLDSPQAVFAVSGFNRVFAKRKKLIKLDGVAEASWASVDAVTALIVGALTVRRAVTR